MDHDVFIDPRSVHNFHGFSEKRVHSVHILAEIDILSCFE